MIVRPLTIAGLLVLLLAWAGPLPHMVQGSFTAHMALHMAVVGIGVPLLAAGIGPFVGARGWLRSQLALPIAASIIDFVVVWGWHAPALHHASRSSYLALTIEQLSFAAVSLLVWLVALTSTGETRRSAALAGAMALFFTSMHMTLLGALIGLAPRAIFGDHAHHATPTSALLADQQLGGVIMLAIGGVIYLAGGLVLMARVLQREEAT
ncbi:cytochrome c oxidase assembly protein [Devosia submarina]|uniref:cytochrome c oxidase assembly protein n=1 Tax=Devosia submarina TaxID=1173082 RepID=UPI000D3D993D|nr:cytochrome c oxidase assembly protein [Devosia submarina]